VNPDLLPPWTLRDNKDGTSDIVSAEARHVSIIECVPSETATYIVALTQPKPRPERLSPFVRDPARTFQMQDGGSSGTGIYVRVKNEDGGWGNADIAELDKASLLGFLRSRGGCNEWAEGVVFAMLGHEG
jgi:hypothetical protein